MNITFLIRALDFGGAERQLVALAQGLHARGHAVKVVVFYAGGPLEADLSAAGVPVVVLNKAGRWDLLGFTLRLARALRAGRPDIVHGYLGGSNIFASLLKPVHRAKVVWGLRATDKEAGSASWFSQLDGTVERRLSRTPDLVISNSHAGKRDAVARGFPDGKIVVIPNGVDTDRFRPDPAGRMRLRAEFGIPDDAPLIGRIGRIHPQKDYPAFLAMAALVATERPEARFLIAGKGPASLTGALRAQAERLGIAEKVIWAGARNDMAAVYSACDLTVSSSAFGEGTPNVVAESLACGVACVATDSGDSGWALGGHGALVPPSDPAALAAAVLDQLARLERGEIDGAVLRQSVLDRLSLEMLYQRTEAALQSLSFDSASRGIAFSSSRALARDLLPQQPSVNQQADQLASMNGVVGARGARPFSSTGSSSVDMELGGPLARGRAPRAPTTPLVAPSAHAAALRKVACGQEVPPIVGMTKKLDDGNRAMGNEATA